MSLGGPQKLPEHFPPSEILTRERPSGSSVAILTAVPTLPSCVAVVISITRA